MILHRPVRASPAPASAEQSAHADALLRLIYADLRRVAATLLRKERPDHTLQATALVHEAYLRMACCPPEEWGTSEHLFRTAARCMRNILVDHARRRRQLKRGGEWTRQPLDETLEAVEARSGDLLALGGLLDQLAGLDPRQSLVVELRFFAGMSMPEIARVLGVSLRTVENDWAFARAWLYREINR